MGLNNLLHMAWAVAVARDLTRGAYGQWWVIGPALMPYGLVIWGCCRSWTLGVVPTPWSQLFEKVVACGPYVSRDSVVRDLDAWRLGSADRLVEEPFRDWLPKMDDKSQVRKLLEMCRPWTSLQIMAFLIRFPGLVLERVYILSFFYKVHIDGGNSPNWMEVLTGMGLTFYAWLRWAWDVCLGVYG